MYVPRWESSGLIFIFFQERNIYYVVQVEVFLTKSFSYDTPEDEDILYDFCFVLMRFIDFQT